MYTKYAQLKNLKIELLSSQEGHTISKIIGKGAYDAFRFETGSHCCQRVPVTESKGRRHTSIVSVAVLPIKNEIWKPLDDKDLEIITQTGKQGAGGQNTNKVASAVRAKHKPTGISVFINGRDQYRNKIEALKILTAKVNDKIQSEIDSSYAKYRRETLGTGCRGAKIRTYNFIESRVVDHRLGTKTGNIKGIMKGELDIIIR